MAAFESFGLAVENQIAGFAEKTSAALIGEVTPALAVLLTLWFTYQAWKLWFGERPGYAGELLLSAARTALIAYFALNAGNFASVAIGGVKSAEAMLLAAVPGHPQNAWASVDVLWRVTADGIASLWNLIGTCGVTRIGEELLLFTAVAVMSALGVMLTSAALGVLLTARVALTLTLAFGPLFMSSLMFPGMSGFFWGWFRSAASYLMTLVLTGAVVLFFSALFSGRVSEITALANSGGASFGIWLQLGITLVITLTASSIIRLIPSVSAGLVGGASMQAVGVGQMLSGIFQPAANAVGGFASGFAYGSGSGPSKLGSSLLGPGALRNPGAAPAAAAGAAAGEVSRLSREAASRISRILSA